MEALPVALLLSVPAELWVFLIQPCMLRQCLGIPPSPSLLVSLSDSLFVFGLRWMLVAGLLPCVCLNSHTAECAAVVLWGGAA